MTQKQNGQAQYIADRQSEEALITQVIEEAGELTQVLAKRLRILKGENYTPISDAENFEQLTEEAADLLLCLNVLNKKIDLQRSRFEEITNQKLSRWVSRLDYLK